MYSLIFIERGRDIDAKSALNGPFIFTFEADAIRRVFYYVRDRIQGAWPDFFLENFDGVSEVAETLLGKGHKDQVAGLEAFFSAVVDPVVQKEIVDWYFDVVNDEQVEAFYTLERVEVEKDNRSLNVLTLGRFTARIVFKGDPLWLKESRIFDREGPIVQFYDSKNVNEHLVMDQTFGQLVSSYMVKTLLEDESRYFTGLCLDGGFPEWSINAKDMSAFRCWMGHRMTDAGYKLA
jgi:hypothetical protein